jgi:hypothetical protein
MSASAAVPLTRSVSPPRIQINWDPPFFLNLLAPAFLLALLRLFSAFGAAAYGLYFTCEAALIAYAYLAIARAVYICHLSRDREGRYDAPRARKAEQGFHRQLSARGASLARSITPVFAVSLVLDLLTAGTRIPWLYATTFGIALIEFMLWMRYGPAFVIACAKWSPTQPFDLSKARRLIADHRRRVSFSFRLVNLVFVCVAVPALVVYRRLGIVIASYLPSNDLLFLYSVVFMAGIAAFALWLHCAWSAYILPRLSGPVSLQEIATGNRDLRYNPRLRWLLNPPAKRG